jgi:predicted ATPase
MEDLEKYLFDPKNPKGFKSYKLLVEIIRRGKNIAFVDPYFLLEIFKEQLINQSIFNDLWDEPENFDQRTFQQKAEVYIKNYSEAELFDTVAKIWPTVSSKHMDRLFNKFIYLKEVPSLATLFQDSIDQDPIKWLEEDLISTKYIESLAQVYLLERYDEVPLTPHGDNIVAFISPRYSKAISKLKSTRASVLITTKEVHSSLNYPRNFHPIILQETSDVHALLDLVKREVNYKKSRSSIVYDKPDTIPYLQQVEIKNYFSLQHIKLSKLAKQREIYLVGENGDGKTLLLQAILLGLKDNRVTGVASDYVDENPTDKLRIKVVDTDKKEYSYTDGLEKEPYPYQHVFAYGINRFRNDSDQKEEDGYLTLFSHEQYLENPVKWLQNIDYREKSGEGPPISLTMAKEILRELLDENVSIAVSPDRVIFNERGTEVSFSQLSDGYKSVIIWVSDLIARLSERQPYVNEIQDFRGIVLVDEIGVYLHPKWQYTIVRKLRRWFPLIQFIFTTHSPIVIMGASKDAAFYKVYKEEGVTKVTEAVDSISNLMANGIITSPLFGLEDARPAAFDESREELDTSDDYLAGKIHQAISQRIQDRNNVTEDDIMSLIQQELDKVAAK